MNKIAVFIIWIYKRFMSIGKGFGCAHHAVHGKGSCSDFALDAFESESLGRAVVATRKRLRECRVAFEQVSSADGVAVSRKGPKVVGDCEIHLGKMIIPYPLRRAGSKGTCYVKDDT